MWFDSHCHLQDNPDPGAAVARAVEHQVDRMICVGTDAGHSRRGVEIARQAKGRVWATVGLHPHSASVGTEETLALLDELAAGPDAEQLVAVGECGLDYHHDNSPRREQREAFAAQINAARSQDLTLVVHSREAWDDTFAVLRSEGMPSRTIFHCFTGGPEEARRCLDLGGYLSFSGIVTFKSAADVRAAAALCPPDRLLVETDSPYLAPVPHRGRPNEPSLLPDVGAGVAAARDEPVELVARRASEVTAEVFGIGAGSATPA